jgi:prolyl-tRNA synthetase
MMPYKNKADRDPKHEWQLEKKRDGAHEARMERQRARRAIDKKHPDRNGNGTADIREGKDVAHRVALSKGGSNNHKVVSEVSTRERKK